MTTLDGIAVYGHFIDGRERPSAGDRTFDVRNPANGTLVARVAEGGAAEIALAVDAADAAFADGRWSRLPGRERYRILNRFADAIEAALPELATLESTCVGRPLREMRAQLGRIPEFYRYFAAVARTRGRRGDAVRRPVSQLRAPRAAGRRRPAHAVEPSAADPHEEARAGARGGQRGRR